MKTDTLQKLIARQNERLEDNAAAQASEIINKIAELQQAKLDADKEIEELRMELKSIQVNQIDATSILGNV